MIDKLIHMAKKVFAFAGIGNFQSFIDCLKSLNLNIIGQKKIHRSQKNTMRELSKKIEKLARNADLLITTKKDFVKLKEKAFKPELCYLEISLRINEKLIDTLVSIC